MATFEKEDVIQEYGSLEAFARADDNRPCLRIYESEHNYHVVRKPEDEKAILTSPYVHNPRLVWDINRGLIRETMPKHQGFEVKGQGSIEKTAKCRNLYSFGATDGANAVIEIRCDQGHSTALITAVGTVAKYDDRVRKTLIEQGCDVGGLWPNAENVTKAQMEQLKAMGQLKRGRAHKKKQSDAKPHDVAPSAAWPTGKVMVTGEQLEQMSIPERLRAEIEGNMMFLRYLATCGKLDHDKMATYLSMMEQFGKHYTPSTKNEMLNAGTLILPKRQSDGTYLDGYEQVRSSNMASHMEAITTFIDLLSKMSPQPSNAAIAKAYLDELDELKLQGANLGGTNLEGAIVAQEQLEECTLLRTLTGHTKPVHCIAISPDGQILASGSADQKIKLWNLRTGELLRTLEGHRGWLYSVSSVAISPDGQTLVSGSHDQTIKIWRMYQPLH